MHISSLKRRRSGPPRLDCTACCTPYCWASLPSLWITMRVLVATTVALIAIGYAVGAAADVPKACDECWGKTSGPCRHNLDWSCHAYQVGTTCPAGTTECGPIDCVVSAWSAWSKCDEDCGGGFQTRSRKVTTLPSHGGAKCPVLEETQACNEHKCGKCCNAHGERAPGYV